MLVPDYSPRYYSNSSNILQELSIVTCMEWAGSHHPLKLCPSQATPLLCTPSSGEPFVLMSDLSNSPKPQGVLLPVQMEFCVTNLCICVCLLPVEWWFSGTGGFSATEGCFGSDGDNPGAWLSSLLFTWMRITIFRSCREDTHTEAPHLIRSLQTSLAGGQAHGPEKSFTEEQQLQRCSRTNL